MEFKDSGIDWISNLPSDWTVQKLKYILSERIEKNNPIKTHNVLSLTAVQGVVPYSEKQASGGNKQKDDLSAYKLAYPNDIVLNSMNIVTGSVGLSNFFGCVSPVYYMFYSKDEDINIKYYNYIFQCKIFQKRLIGFGNGILQMTSEAGNLYAVRMKIPIDKFKNLSFPVPPINVQNDIVSYLDKKTMNIKNIIEKYKKLVELLEEKKYVLINQVITKGLNSKVPMKDSKIEWMGPIPEHWNIQKLKFLSKNLDNKRVPISGDERKNGSIPYYGATGIVDYINDYIFNEKLLLIGEDGAPFFDKTKNVSFLISGKSWVNNHAHVLKVDETKIIDKLMMYCLNCTDYSLYIKGSTRDKLNQDQLNNIPILLPPMDEQKTIVFYLEKEVLKINKIINYIKENINLLEEYETSLIYHVITGKIDVRDEI